MFLSNNMSASSSSSASSSAAAAAAAAAVAATSSSTSSSSSSPLLFAFNTPLFSSTSVLNNVYGGGHVSNANGNSNNNSNSGSSKKRNTWFSLDLVCGAGIVVLAWILNLIVLFLIRRYPGRSHIKYCYLRSLSIANLLLVSLDFPVTILEDFLPSSGAVKNTLCLLLTFLDTFLCNLTTLLLLCNTVDSLFRIKTPVQYHQTRTNCQYLTKILTPWLTSGIQTSVMLALSSHHPCNITGHICVLHDPNFFIIRTVLGFGIPLISSGIIIMITIKYISQHAKLAGDNKMLLSISSSSSCYNTGKSTLNFNESSEQIKLDVMLPKFECFHDTILSDKSTQIVQHHCPQHGILTFPMTSSQVALNSADVHCRIGNTNINTNTNQWDPSSTEKHSPDIIPSSSKYVSFSSSDVILNPTISSDNDNNNNNNNSCDFVNIKTNIPDNHALTMPVSNVNNNSNSSSNRMDNNDDVYSTSDVNNNEVDTNYNNINSQLVNYREERQNSIYNLTVCLLVIVLWGPLVTGTLIQSICLLPNCPFSVSFSKINEFKWLSYSSSAIVPLILLIMNSEVRRTFISILTCSYDSYYYSEE